MHDVLPAQNTVVNTTWLGLDYARSKLKIKNTLRWQLYHQLDSDKALALRSLRDRTTFFGLINKAEYRIEIASLTLIPGWKSEFLRFNSFTAGKAARREHRDVLQRAVGLLDLVQRAGVLGVERAHRACSAEGQS